MACTVTPAVPLRELPAASPEKRARMTKDREAATLTLKLVYRALRRISRWSLEFYSDVYVVGQENVPAYGPLIVTPCHHNEIIDIATLSVTMPHARPVCFWAKASMFAHPVTRWIMSSSGAIPVRRNPNRISNGTAENAHGNGSMNGTSSAAVRSSLFHETFQALDSGEVIGLFPEGTSYTEPQIAQIKEGAAWVALEYAKAYEERTGMHTGLVIVPVGIVYTKKSWYQSRVYVEYGQPIDVSYYAKRYGTAVDSVGSKAAIKELTGKLEQSIIHLTINAPDWDTWFAANIARDIAWRGSWKIPLPDWVQVSRSFISLFAEPTEVKPTAVAATNGKKALVTYCGLLYHTGMTHDDFVAVYPTSKLPSPSHALSVCILQLFKTAFHPRFWLFLPPLLLHVPAYITGTLAGRYLPSRGEEEARAQFKALPAGIVYGLSSFFVGLRLSNMLFDGGHAYSRVPGILANAGRWFLQNVPSMLGLRRVVSTIVMMYWVTWLFFRWHTALINGNYTQFRLLAVSWKVLRGISSRPSHDVTIGQLDLYLRPPLPALNPYIKRKNPLQVGNDVMPSVREVGSPGSSRLIRHLFAARQKAEAVVSELCPLGYGMFNKPMKQE